MQLSDQALSPRFVPLCGTEFVGRRLRIHLEALVVGSECLEQAEPYQHPKLIRVGYRGLRVARCEMVPRLCANALKLT